ncbi:MAG: hypothetical protein D6800_05395 [Candidatus Zixiibacteriota bacterium]|nr:MAG: hypothetical protein D6800_05395 [candidate division Zixibacteria bacterium]
MHFTAGTDRGKETQMRVPRYTKIILPLLALFASGSLLAHKGEKHGEEEEQQPKVEVSVQEQLDSLYARINLSFATVKPILQQDCYNCHSNQTKYPWYYKIPGIKGMIDGDIKEARKHVDFSNGFPFGGHGNPLEDLQAIRDEVAEGDMPPFSYRMMHWGSTINGTQRDSLFQWIDSTMKILTGFYDEAGIPYTPPGAEHDDDEESED